MNSRTKVSNPKDNIFFSQHFSSIVDWQGGEPQASAELYDPTEDQHEITELLLSWNDGAPGALDLLIARVFAELRQVARNCMRRERFDHTLQPTALVHEVYLRLAGQRKVAWASRFQFFSFAADLMRRILVDHARRHRAEKRGQGIRALALEDILGLPEDCADLVRVDEALRDLERLDSRQAKVVELRFFCGLNVDEITEILGISRATVLRDWRTAKLWLKCYLRATHSEQQADSDATEPSS